MGWRGNKFEALRYWAKIACVVVFAGPIVFGLTSRAQTPDPAKVDKLIELLSDPSIKSWLVQQAKQAPPAPAAAQESPSMMLSSYVTMIRQHFGTLSDAIPQLPAQFTRAWNILLAELESAQLL